MKRKLFILTAMFVAVMLGVSSCGDNVGVNVEKGSGQIRYDGKNYDVNLSTILTMGPGNDGKYTHVASFVSSVTGNFFTFTINNNSVVNDIPVGEYNIVQGAATASFGIKPDGVNLISGNPTGSMIVTRLDNVHNFNFTGTDLVGSSSAKSVSFKFKGTLLRIH